MGGHKRKVNEGNHAVREASATEISTHPADDARRKTSISSRSYQDWRFLTVAGGIVALAFLLRIYRIGDHEFWYDEALSFSMLPMRWTAIPLIDFNPPLHQFLLRAWAALAGQSEAALRALSAAVGTLFVAAVIWAGREIFDARVGLWSGAFAAVAPMHIYYSQEARTYVLLTLTPLLTYVTLWRAMRRNTWGSWALVSACAALALYSHYFAILALLPTVFLLLLWPEKQEAKQRWIRYAGAMFLSGLALLPWLLFSFAPTLHGAFTSTPGVGVSWMAEAVQEIPKLLLIPKSLEILGLGSQADLTPFVLKQFTYLQFPHFLRILGLALLLPLGIWVLLPWGDNQLGVLRLGTRKAWLAIHLFFPLAALWLVSFITPIYVVGRYDIIAFPAYALLMGLAFAKLQRVRRIGPILAAVVALGLLIPIGTKLVLYYRTAPERNQARRIASALHRLVANGDTVVFTDLSGLPALYYLSRLGYRWEDRSCLNELAGRRFSCQLYPRESEQPYFAPAAYNPNPTLQSEHAAREDVANYLAAASGSESSLWVVFGDYRLSEGRHFMTEEDVKLTRELLRVGLKATPNIGSFGVFRFRRS